MEDVSGLIASCEQFYWKTSPRECFARKLSAEKFEVIIRNLDIQSLIDVILKDICNFVQLKGKTFPSAFVLVGKCFFFSFIFSQ